MADLLIKPDPDTKGASPGALSEEDIYEDAGDLEFFNDPAFAAAYMAKIPKYVWEQWATLDDDAEIRIGTIRVAKVLDQTGNPSVGHPFSEARILLTSVAAKTWNAFGQEYGHTSNDPQRI